MHRRSARLPQLFHTCSCRRLCLTRIASIFTLFAGGFVGAATLLAQAPISATAPPGYRVFLKDGHALPSFGEPATVDDRIVFQFKIATASDPPALQLVSLPAAVVDVDRTAKYAEAVRAAGYAATRGEADYAAMSEEVARALAELEKVENLDQRRALAALARQRLLDWSRAHYAYRAADIQELAGFFDDVASSRMAPGEKSLTVSLVAGPPVPAREPLRAEPDLRESIELALAAVAASDVPDERVAVLRAAASAAAMSSPDLEAAVAARLDSEAKSASAYANLAASVRARADAARRQGDVETIETLLGELMQRDRELGYRRPGDVAALGADLATALDRARNYRLALDHYAYAKPALLRYERRIRAVLSAFTQHRALLEAIRAMRGVGFAQLESAVAKLKQFERAAAVITPPAELASVHATVESAIQMAREACERRRVAVVTNKTQTAREASSAAAGALLLADAARADLVSGLFPPKPGE